jgi:hypothetical protein
MNGHPCNEWHWQTREEKSEQFNYSSTATSNLDWLSLAYKDRMQAHAHVRQCDTESLKAKSKHVQQAS